MIGSVRDAGPDDLKPVEALRRADSDSLGFVPTAKYQHIVNQTVDRGRRRWLYETLMVHVDNGDVTGFILAGFHRDGLKIEQICVRNDARRMERALSLLSAAENEAWRRGSKRARCRVAADIDANLFWTAAGYSVVATVGSTFLNNSASKSGRLLFVYDKQLTQTALPLFETAAIWSTETTRGQ